MDSIQSELDQVIVFGVCNGSDRRANSTASG
jgi:hypothetical protein